MIEIETRNGYKKLVAIDEIATVGELGQTKANNVVISLKNGETLFAVNNYDDIYKQLRLKGAF